MMRPTPPAPSGSDHRASADPLSWRWHAAGQLVVLLWAGALSSFAVYHGCVNPGIQFSGVEAGTPRAGYCAAIVGTTWWLFSLAVPVAALVLWFAVPLARRRPVSGWLLLLAWAIALGANAAIVNSLQFNYNV